MTSALWGLYLETLNFQTLTAMVNQLKWQGPSSPRTKPTRTPHHPNLSFLLLPNALISMQEPSSPSPSSFLMLSTGLSIYERERKKQHGFCPAIFHHTDIAYHRKFIWRISNISEPCLQICRDCWVLGSNCKSPQLQNSLPLSWFSSKPRH